MRLCFISNLFEPYARGGAEEVVKTVLKGFQNENNEIFLITTKPWQGFNSLLPKIYFEDGIKIYRFYPLNIFSYFYISQKPVWLRFIWHLLDIFNWHSFLVVSFILKKEKPALVMLHNLKGLGTFLVLAIRKRKTPYLQTLHDTQYLVPSGLIIKGQENHWQVDSLLVRVYRFFNQKLLGSPSLVISPSRWLLDFYNKRGFFKNSKKTVLPNPIRLPEVEFLSMNNRNSKITTFLYLGQIEKHKGIFFLMEVFKKLLNEFDTMNNESRQGRSQSSSFIGRASPLCILQIIGQGTYLETIKEISRPYSSSIIIRGFIPAGQLDKIFQGIDFTIVPSLCYENSPLVIYQSLSLGVPVIASRLGGMAELIKNGYNGFTFEAGDSEDLLRVIKYCLENKRDWLNLKQNAIKSVNGFRVENYISQILNNFYEGGTNNQIN